LLERGAKTNDGESIYHAAQMDLDNMLQLLAEFGADFSQEDPNWTNTPLYFNAGHRVSDTNYENAMRGVEWILDHGANPNVKSYDCRETPIFPAVRNGNARMVRALVAHGADVNVQNDKGLTPYILAAVTGAADVMEILAEAGADTTLPDPGPFLADCAAGCIDKVNEALVKDPDIVKRLGDRERRVLPKMAELGRTVGVKTCLDAGFPIDSHGQDKATALHFACYCQWDETASLLIQRGAPLELRDAAYNSTPLGWVLEGFLHNRNAKGDGIRIVKELLEAGASDENLKARLESDDAENPAMIELMEALNQSS
jgi:ankyrin repeat protein